MLVRSEPDRTGVYTRNDEETDCDVKISRSLVCYLDGMLILISTLSLCGDFTI